MLVSHQVFAQQSTYRADTIIRIQSGDTLQHNVMLTGESIEVMGYLDNDLFAASRNLLLNGEVADDAFMAGRIVSFSGYIGDMLVTAGETVVIDGIIEGDLFVAGQSVRIAEQAHIRGNAFVAGNDIRLEGATVEGTLRSAGGTLFLDGTINHSTAIYSNEVTFGESYRSRYGTTITSSEPLHRENLGMIPENLALRTEEFDIWSIVLFQVWLFLSLLVTGLVLIRLFQKTAIDMSKFATENFWKNTAWGVGTFFAVPITIMILSLLFVTIPLSILLVLSYGVALLISYLLVAISLGVLSIIFFRGEAEVSSYYWGLALGMVFIAILSNLPFIGFILNILLLFFGLGSLTNYLWQVTRSARGTSSGNDHGGDTL
ncbi:MAG: polymer-forming cytoskeletal protein [Balneolaceae bacterium]|nr:polymer-forming cytoskeletal protein [Balneolaceae bacterium]